MTKFIPLIKKTSAYKAISSDIKNGKLSHAYLINTQEERFLTEYLKVLSKLILCENDLCGECRTCSLIDSLLYPDLKYYPKNSQNVLTEDISDLIEESCFKPIENKIKLFVLDKAQTMNASAQNKLLKTLEEPPNNVCILIGANGQFNLLPTLQSRVKKLEIGTFNNQDIFEVLKDGREQDKLLQAINCGNGTVGRVLSLYEDGNLSGLMDFFVSVVLDMKSSKEVLDFSNKATALNCTINEFLSVAEIVFRDMLMQKLNKTELVTNKTIIQKLSEAPKFSQGALVYILDKINQAKRREKFNANATMLIEWVLFSILEGKFKWQKL